MCPVVQYSCYVLKVTLQSLVTVCVSWNRLLDSRERRVVPEFITRRRFAHYGACCGVKPFSVKTEGRRQCIPTNPADMLSDFVFSWVKMLDVVLRTITLLYLRYRVGHEKVDHLPFCTCPCDILSGVIMFIAWGVWTVSQQSCCHHVEVHLM